MLRQPRPRPAREQIGPTSALTLGRDPFGEHGHRVAVTFNAGKRFRPREERDENGHLVVATRVYNKLARRIVRSISRKMSTRLGRELFELWSLRRHAPRRRQVIT